MQPVIILDRLSTDEMKNHSGHRRLPVTVAATAANNLTPVRPSKMTRRQKTPNAVSNGQSPAKTVVPLTRSTRSKATPVTMESTRSRRNKNV